jgi:hypothetical protein
LVLSCLDVLPLQEAEAEYVRTQPAMIAESMPTPCARSNGPHHDEAGELPHLRANLEGFFEELKIWQHHQNRANFPKRTTAVQMSVEIKLMHFFGEFEGGREKSI